MGSAGGRDQMAETRVWLGKDRWGDEGRWPATGGVASRSPDARARARGGAGTAESGRRGLRGLRIALQKTTAQTRGPRAHLQNRSTNPIAMSSVPSAISKDVSQTGRCAPSSSSHTREEGRHASGRSREVRGRHLPGGSGRSWPALGGGGRVQERRPPGDSGHLRAGPGPAEIPPKSPESRCPPTTDRHLELGAGSADPSDRFGSRGGGAVSHAHREGPGRGWSVPHLPPSLPRCVPGARCLRS